jgi:uncharacterized protein (TIGR04168 family)
VSVRSELHSKRAEPGRIAVIGDVHGSWDDFDVEYFNQSDCDLLLFVGDLGGTSLRSVLKAARSIALLERPALVLPGNNDAVHIAQVAAELVRHSGLIKLTSGGHGRRSQALDLALGGVEMCGYGLHPFSAGGAGIDIISCRPHSMGGPDLSFAPFLESRYGVSTLEQSAVRLMKLVDQSESESLGFFAPNGAKGRGASPHHHWGCDLQSQGGDWGDEDLTRAIAYAKSAGKRVLAVVAGHMHLRVRGGGERPWRVVEGGTLYLNAARVPRIFPSEGGRRRHHLSLTLTGDAIEAVEMRVQAVGED